MFTDFVVQPIFNLLVLIYALIPGHNFGLAIVIFTVVIRLLMWPLVKKQLRQTKITRQLQPELKRIKKEAKGDRQREGCRGRDQPAAGARAATTLSLGPGDEQHQHQAGERQRQPPQRCLSATRTSLKSSHAR